MVSYFTVPLWNVSMSVWKRSFLHKSLCASKKGGCLGCRFVPVSKGLSNGGKAGITLAVLAAFALLVVLPIVLLKRRKGRRRAEADQAESRAKLVDAAHDPEIGHGASNGFH